MRIREGIVLLALGGSIASSACGARSSLDVPAGAGGEGGGPLVCPAIKTCGEGTPECRSCVAARINSCLGLTDCDAGAGGCAGALPDVHACRVWSAEIVGCLVDCSGDVCRDAYWSSGRGPIYPLGLAFDTYDCAVCSSCAEVCSGAPSFALLCEHEG